MWLCLVDATYDFKQRLCYFDKFDIGGEVQNTVFVRVIGRDEELKEKRSGKNKKSRTDKVGQGVFELRE